MIVYDTEAGNGVLRLKGFNIEGGPFGLFYAFVFSLVLIFYKKCNLNLLYLIIPIILVYFAQSKAGIIMVFLSAIIYVYQFFNIKINGISLKKLMIALLLPIIAILSYYSLQQYIKYFLNPTNNIEINTGDLDANLVMGRISASIIIPNMIKENPIGGIGLGNYPILRNKPSYRSFLPQTPSDLTDSSGLGAFVDILTEGGVVFFLFFIFIIFKIWKKYGKYEVVFPLLLIFIFIFLLGLQIHFMYNWFIISLILIIAYRSTMQNINSTESKSVPLSNKFGIYI